MNRQQGFGGPMIPGGGFNKPQGNQFKINIDIMSLPNAKCIKCDNERFSLVCNMKMISPMQSPTGDWAHGVAQWWECSNPECKHKFDSKEWIDKIETIRKWLIHQL